MQRLLRRANSRWPTWARRGATRLQAGSIGPQSQRNPTFSREKRGFADVEVVDAPNPLWPTWASGGTEASADVQTCRRAKTRTGRLGPAERATRWKTGGSSARRHGRVYTRLKNPGILSECRRRRVDVPKLVLADLASGATRWKAWGSSPTPGNRQGAGEGKSPAAHLLRRFLRRRRQNLQNFLEILG
jgi:hypothetical protein